MKGLFGKGKKGEKVPICFGFNSLGYFSICSCFGRHKRVYLANALHLHPGTSLCLKFRFPMHARRTGLRPTSQQRLNGILGEGPRRQGPGRSKSALSASAFLGVAAARLRILSEHRYLSICGATLRV